MKNNKLVKLKNSVIKILKTPLFYVLIGLFFIDILSKWLVQINLKVDGNSVVLIPNFLSVTLTHNKGTLWGLGDDVPWVRPFLICIRLLLAIGIPVGYFWKGKGMRTRYKVCLVLIYAGCIGNLIDSAFYWKNITGFNGVIDWISFSFFPPIFNLADSYVTIAVFLLIILFIIDEIKEIKEKNRSGAYTMTPEEYEKKLAEEKIKNENKNN